MKPTTIRTLLAMFVSGFSLGYLTNLVLVSFGRPAANIPFSLAITLVLISVLTLALAWPIRQRLRGKRTQPLDMLHAGRVSALAKTTSLVGGIMLGVTIGFVYFFLTRAVIPEFPILAPALVAVAGSVIMVIAGLVAERWCTLPPDDSGSAQQTGVASA